LRPQSNRELLVALATKLRPLLPDVVFVGGCATSLLITDPAAAPVRVTDDVDVIVAIASYVEYARFSKRLRALGFSEDSAEGAPICRWLIDDMKLDVMPTDRTILGFSNRWYKPALRSVATIFLDDLELRVVTAPYFIGTKLEAFRGRGKGDFYASSDLEDIITVIDGRPSLVEEISNSPSVLRNYVSREIGKFLDSREFVNALPGHLPGDEISQARIPSILRTLDSLRTFGPKQTRTATPTRRRRQKS
jgi:predicted nucleotidyltransferase